jgi:hypothetical protein
MMWWRGIGGGVMMVEYRDGREVKTWRFLGAIV